VRNEGKRRVKDDSQNPRLGVVRNGNATKNEIGRKTKRKERLVRGRMGNECETSNLLRE